MVKGGELPSSPKTLSCTSAAGNTAILKTAPCCANHVSVHPPLSQIRIGALLLMRRSIFRESAVGGGVAFSVPSTVGRVNFVRTDSSPTDLSKVTPDAVRSPSRCNRFPHNNDATDS